MPVWVTPHGYIGFTVMAKLGIQYGRIPTGPKIRVWDAMTGGCTSACLDPVIGEDIRAHANLNTQIHHTIEHN